MTWTFTSGTASWRPDKWLLVLLTCALPSGLYAEEADMAFLAYLGGWETETGDSETPLEWQAFLDAIAPLEDEGPDAAVAEMEVGDENH